MVFHACRVKKRAIQCGNAWFAMREWVMGEKSSIPEALQLFRKNAKMSQEGLAETAGVGRSTVQDIERGLSSPTIETLGLIAKALKIPLSDFFPAAHSAKAPSFTDAVSLLEAFQKAKPARRAIALFFLTGDKSHLEAFPEIAPAFEAFAQAKL